MLSSKLKELAQYKAKIASLENAIESARVNQLRNLHTEMGFDTREELIAALRGLGGGRGKRRGRPPGRSGKAKKKAGRKRGGRKARAVITPALKAKIISAVKGGATGNAVAEKFDVSLPTVQNIKRDAGLTRKGKK